MGTYITQDLTQVLNSLSSAYLILDFELSVLKASDSAIKLFGWHKEEVIGKNLNDIEKRYLNIPFFDALESTIKDGIRRDVVDNGGIAKGITSSSIARVGDVLLVETADLTSMYEMTWRERMKAQQYEDLLDTMDEAVLIVDCIEQTLTPNKVCIDVFGDVVTFESNFFATLFNLPLIATNHYIKTQVADDEPYLEFLEKFKDVWLSGQPKIELIDRKINEVTTKRVRKMWRWEYEGKPRGIFMTSTDLTDLFAARVDAATASTKVKQILKELDIWIGVYDEAVDSLTVSYPDGHHALFAEFKENLPREWRNDIYQALSELDLSGSAAVILRDRASNRFIKSTLTFITAGEPGTRKVLAVSQDVTAELQAHQGHLNKVDQSRVQQFAQGIAHDFGNVAQSFDGYVKLLRNEIPSERGAEMLNSLEASANRALRIARKVSEVARFKVIKNEPFNVLELLDEGRESFEQLLSGDVTLKIQINPELDGTVFANPDQIELILENLIENANRALAGSGTIQIRCEADSADDYLKITVFDDGPAIPKPIAERIFEPFISNRKEDNTGLGLYLAHEYLQTCGGEIKLHNQNRDVAFTLRLARPQTEIAS